jgi:hypothetical protein
MDEHCLEGETCLPSGVCVAEQRAASHCGYDLVPLNLVEDAGEPGRVDAGTGAGDAGSGVPNDAGQNFDAGETDAGAICMDDAYEPNDTIDDASEMWSNGVVLEICDGGDMDFFAIDLEQGEQLEATILFSQESGDLDMKLLGPLPSTQALETAQSPTDNETINLTAPSDGTYVLQVYGWMDAGTQYELDVSTSGSDTPDDICLDDDLEENDSFAQATALPLGGEIEAVICPNDPDFFLLTGLEPNAPFGLILETSTEGEISGALFEADSSTPFATIEVNSPGNSIEFISGTADLYVVIASLEDAAIVYQLSTE